MLMPADPVDAAFLEALGDYKFGRPVASKRRTAEAIRADGYVGLYVTAETLRRPAVMAKTGWENPEKVLGQEWTDADC